MATKKLTISTQNHRGEGYSIPCSPAKDNRHPSTKYVHAKLRKRVKPYPIELLTLNPVDPAECYNQVIKLSWEQNIKLSEAFLIWKDLLITYFGHCRYENIESLMSAGNRANRVNNKK